jgi:demethylmenaquinone methyltransferase/2-methoxy-6-polyprenyl-1,4-benzoquinol methylase
MDDKPLQEQLEYYRARAQEFDESIQGTGRFASGAPLDPQVGQEYEQIRSALRALPRADRVLELACGTGIWTGDLLAVSESITALDGAPEMLEAHRAKFNDSRITHQQADLFEWEPDDSYDLVFFAFWLSHVPPDELERFLDKVAAAVRPGGRVFIVDEPQGGRQLSGPVHDDLTQTRQLHDGRSYRIVKVYYDPAKVEALLGRRGFGGFERMVGEYFFTLNGARFL